MISHGISAGGRCFLAWSRTLSDQVLLILVTKGLRFDVPPPPGGYPWPLKVIVNVAPVRSKISRASTVRFVHFFLPTTEIIIMSSKHPQPPPTTQRIRYGDDTIRLVSRPSGRITRCYLRSTRCAYTEARPEWLLLVSPTCSFLSSPTPPDLERCGLAKSNESFEAAT
jgi:hypothetical protein